MKDHRLSRPHDTPNRLKPPRSHTLTLTHRDPHPLLCPYCKHHVRLAGRCTPCPRPRPRPRPARHRRRQMAPKAACRRLSFIALTLSSLAACNPCLPSPLSLQSTSPEHMSSCLATAAVRASPSGCCTHQCCSRQCPSPLVQAGRYRHWPHALVTMVVLHPEELHHAVRPRVW